MDSFNDTTQRGFALVEVVIGFAITAVIVLVFTSSIAKAIKVNSLNERSFRAQLYLMEMIEVGEALSNTDWSLVGSSPCLQTSPCHPEISGGHWVLTNGQETLDGTVVRRMYFEDVYRDQLTFPNTIVTPTTPGALVDPDTRKIVAEIFWNTSYGTKNLTLESYVYNQ